MHAFCVFRAIRAVAKALAADGASELLICFAVHARAHMRLEQVAVGKGLAADGALKWFLPCMLFAVHVALLLSDESEVATRVIALMRLPFGVGMQVA